MKGDPNSFPFQEISLSHLKCVMKVAEFHGVSRAADEVARTQTAVTKAINKVEQALGLSLFERSSTGMWPTPAGEILVERIRIAAFELTRAGNFFQHQSGSIADVRTIPLFNMTMGTQALMSFVKVFELRDLERAGEALGVTSTTVQRSIRKIESQLGLKLFVRTATNVLMPSVVATEIATAVKVAFAELQIGFTEIQSMDGRVKGRVRVGTLPFVRTALVPKVIATMCSQYPDVSFSTNESPYVLLERGLRSGELDLVVGPTPRVKKHSDLRVEHFLKTGLYIIVRSGHPLAEEGVVSREQLGKLQWLLPPMPALHREVFEKFMRDHEIPVRSQLVETSAQNTMISILESTDFAAISVIPNIKARPPGEIKVLTPDFLDNKQAPYMYIDYHIITRKRSAFSSPVEIFVSQLRWKARELALAED